jgi:hypothetical protein
VRKKKRRLWRARGHVGEEEAKEVTMGWIIGSGHRW